MTLYKNIEWLGKDGDTWNVVTGCPGPELHGQPLDEEGHCEGCYAKFRALNRMRGRFGYDKDEPFKLTWHESQFMKPIKRKKPTLYFVSSMGEWLVASEGWRQRILQIMLVAEWHIFITLTKQYDKLHLIEEDMQHVPFRYGKESWAEILPHRSFDGDRFSFYGPPVEGLDLINSALKIAEAKPGRKILIPPNIWIGVSISYRSQLGGLDKLRELDAPLKFVSFEPMMEDLSDANLTGLDWIIIGGRTRQGSCPAFMPEESWVKGFIENARSKGILIFIKPNAGWFGPPLQEMPFAKMGGWPK